MPIKVVTIINTIAPIIQSTIPEITRESLLRAFEDFEILNLVFIPKTKPIIQKNIPKRFSTGMKLRIKPIIPRVRVVMAKSLVCIESTSIL